MVVQFVKTHTTSIFYKYKSKFKIRYISKSVCRGRGRKTERHTEKTETYTNSKNLKHNQGWGDSSM